MTRQVSTLITNAACKWSFSALKLVRTYLPMTNGMQPKPASHDASCAQGFGCSSLYAQGTYVIGSCDTLISKVACGGFENVFF